jgi:hypothetical protein
MSAPALPRGQRINVIALALVTETLIAFKMDPGIGLPAAEVAKAYVRARTEYPRIYISNLGSYRWRSHCRGSYQTPIAA